MRTVGCLSERMQEETIIGLGLWIDDLGEAYPNCTVLEARPCYNVARLMFLDAER